MRAKTSRIKVDAVWDDEAKVWVATSNDVPGLATEASTAEALLEKLKTLIPELLEANGYTDTDSGGILFALHTEREAVAKR